MKISTLYAQLKRDISLNKTKEESAKKSNNTEHLRFSHVALTTAYIQLRQDILEAIDAAFGIEINNPDNTLTPSPYTDVSIDEKINGILRDAFEQSCEILISLYEKENDKKQMKSSIWAPLVNFTSLDTFSADINKGRGPFFHQTRLAPYALAARNNLVVMDLTKEKILEKMKPVTERKYQAAM